MSLHQYKYVIADDLDLQDDGHGRAQSKNLNIMQKISNHIWILLFKKLVHREKHVKFTTPNCVKIHEQLLFYNMPATKFANLWSADSKTIGIGSFLLT